MDMDFKVGDIIVDLDRNGNPIGKPYAITKEFLSEYNPLHNYWEFDQPGSRFATDEEIQQI